MKDFMRNYPLKKLKRCYHASCNIHGKAQHLDWRPVPPEVTAYDAAATAPPKVTSFGALS